jgi:LPS export ABC transporter protein LptC
MPAIYLKFKNALTLNLLASLVFVSCGPNLKKGSTLADKSILDTEKADSVTIFYSNNGHTKAKLMGTKFQHIINAQPAYVEMSEGIQVTFYNDNNGITSVLTAKRGRYFENNSNVLVRENVIVRNERKEELHTEELIWNEQLQKFFTEKAVQIKTPTQILYGDGMEANQDFTEYTILHPKGVIQVANNAILPN